MEKVMTATELKKLLKSLSQKALIDLVCRLYKSDDKNKQILNTLFLGDTYASSLLTESEPPPAKAGGFSWAAKAA